ncbi:MAG: TonB-dependent receptor [Hyphomonadaceae bacterium]
MKGFKRILVLAASSFALAGGAIAQDAVPAQDAAGAPEGIQTFEPTFFARFNPVTAEDMVRQLPGFTLDEGQDLRGFAGAAGNVLIDGRRPSSKTSLRDELSRIAARDVLRIELIRASAAGDLDVRGYTELANVVLKPASEMKVSTTFAATTRWYEQGRLGAQIGGTRSWKTDNFGFRLAIQGTSLGEREEVDATFRDMLGVVTRTQDEFYQQQVNELLITGVANWTPSPRDTFNANFRILPRWYTTNAAASATLAGGAPLGVIAFDYEEKDIWYVDLGGDYEHKFDGQNAVKLISVNRLVNWRPQQVLTLGLNPLIAPQVDQVDDSENRAGEHVLRGVWTTKPDTQHTIELGLEGAYNYRRVNRQSLVGPIGGPYAPVAIPVASTKVEEDRVEASINDVWRISQQLTLEAGFNYESSTISQTISQPVAPDVERDFTYSKPRVVATWQPGAEDQWRLSIGREVSQLDFGDFATGLNSISTQANVGNPQLVPEQTWKSSLQWKRQLGERGSLSITGFYDDIEDTQDLIQVAGVCTTPALTAGACTAVGNIGDGKRWGARIEATLPLDGVGVTGGLLKLNVGAQDSEVTDPVLLQKRQISAEQEFDWTLDFRQDMPDIKVAWGAKVNTVGPLPNYRGDRLETIEPSEPNVDLFVETTALLGGLLVRLTAANLLDVEKETDRLYYAPPTRVEAFDEFRSSTMGRNVTLTIAGAF